MPVDSYSKIIIKIATPEVDCPGTMGTGNCSHGEEILGRGEKMGMCTVCNGTSKVPLIRVRETCSNDNHKAVTRSICPDCNGSGGTWRTLRRKCGYCRGRGEHVAFDKSMVNCFHCQDEVNQKGRGWLPVDKDEALAVCIQWLLEGDEELSLLADAVDSYCVRRFSFRNGEPVLLGQGPDIYSAVFAAVGEVSGG